MLKTFNRRFTRSLLASLLAISFVCLPISALDNGNKFTDTENNAVWQVLGPNGGDVRSIAIDPRDVAEPGDRARRLILKVEVPHVVHQRRIEPGRVDRARNAAGKDDVFLETVGVGQGEIDIARTADVSIVMLVPGTGDEIQALKADSFGRISLMRGADGVFVRVFI